ncbi:MAG: transcriptional repressor LexA [Alphaproteobacteria bacterium]|nr:transcriptional repressor LexA [Alphaproteobacteria bacterium]
MLTQKQHDLLLLIHEHLQKSDIPPSFEEMKEALGLRSKSGIHRLITALVERGYIERLPHRARALEIKRLPDSLQKKDPVKPQLAVNNDALYHAAIDIPLYGKIAAGTPIEAIRDEGTFTSVPVDMIGSGEHYALSVDGDSMIKAGIFDEDTVIIKKCDTAEDGAIVVALVDGEEVTLKRLKRDKEQVTLIPENDDYEPRILEPDRVKIQGTLVSLIRRYN